MIGCGPVPMSIINKIQAREILDSRGNPTLEVTVATQKVTASAKVPSGASTGSHEALELRDGDAKRYLGKGVLKACGNVNTILGPALAGKNVEDQTAIDQFMIELDGTPNKSKLGANAILGVSLACAHAAAKEKGVSLYKYLNPQANVLPVPMMNIVNGGQHAASGLDIQEIMIMPLGAPSFKEAVRMGSEIFHCLGNILKEKKFSTTVGDEGGYAPTLPNEETAFEYILQAVEKAGYRAGKDVYLAIDAAATEFYDANTKQYCLKIKGKFEKLPTSEMIDYWTYLCKKYPIFSLEDGLAEDDWDGWKILYERLGKKIQIVGDDLLVTNKKRLEKAIQLRAANAILIKLNQIGTLTETMDTVNAAHQHKWKCIVSHRSGETEDTTIADFAVAMETGQIKTGSLSRSERTAKYNRLMKIEEELGQKARFSENFL